MKTSHRFALRATMAAACDHSSSAQITAVPPSSTTSVNRRILAAK